MIPFKLVELQVIPFEANPCSPPKAEPPPPPPAPARIFELLSKCVGEPNTTAGPPLAPLPAEPLGEASWLLVLLDTA